MTDLHGDMMPDASERMQVFIDTMNQREVDFVIQLGDLCPVGANGEHFVKLYKGFNGPKYHVLGNHDTADCEKAEAVAILGMKDAYYSFTIKGYKCIVLDTNYHYDESMDSYVDFDRHKLENRSMPYVPPAELTWLKKELEEDCPIILFSHTNLSGVGTTGIGNAHDLWSIIQEANNQAGYKKVMACFHGHDHFDSTHVYRGVYSLGLPSISNQWIGGENRNTDIDKATLEDYPDLIRVVPYKEPLFTVVTCDAHGLKIEEKETEYVGGSPAKYGRDLRLHNDYMSSKLKGKILPI